MNTGIEELDEQISFWKDKPEAVEHAIVTAFFVGMTLGFKMERERRPALPVVKQRAAPGSKRRKEEDGTPDCILHESQ